ncbi:MAG: hypothetical protein WC825_07090 [Gallionellaceae bacterium]|jgi:hypothetical protein
MKLMMILIAVLIASNASATGDYGEDLENCRWSDGSVMPVSRCDDLRAKQARKVEDERAAQLKREEDVRNAQHKREYDAEEARKEEGRQRYLEQLDRDVAEEHAEEAKVEAALKRKCGKDYKNPRIGMPLLRAHLCVGPLHMESKTHTREGVVFAYDSEYGYIKMIDKKIISWQKY